MTVEKIEFLGFKNCYKIEWSHFKMIITEDVGPRILSLSYNDNRSIFGIKKHSGENDVWNLYGGHRLWHAPENKDRTYYPDNQAIQIEIIDDKYIVMRQGIESTTGIKKTVTLEILTNSTSGIPYVQVNHYLENKGVWPINCAPWSISVLTKDTKAIIPLSNDELSGFLPKTSLSLWNYTKLSDPRMTLGNKYIMVEQKEDVDGSLGSNKIGSKVNSGWSASICPTNSTLFVKIIDKDVNNLQVDLGCNVEVYTDSDILELETVGKYQTLEPSSPLSPPIDFRNVTHSTPFIAKLTENWYLFQINDIPTPLNDNDIDKNILPIINQILN